MKSNLSVIIPLYNQEKYIKQCVESVINQKNINVSIIIVNDGSTDNSLNICEKIAAVNNNVRIITQSNQGLAGARKTGIEVAETKYITFLDADDFVTSEAYSEAENFMQRDVDEIFYEISRYYSNERIKREYHVIDSGFYDKNRIEKEIYPRLIWDFNRNTPGIECSQCVRVVKKNLLIEAYENLHGKSFYYGEDIAITYPLMTRIKTLAVVSESYYMHRQRENNGVPPYIASKGYFEEIFNLYRYLRISMNKNVIYDFNKQIDYMYMYSIELKKWAYGDYKYDRNILFPFNKLPEGRKVILYGAGIVGNSYYNQLNKLSYCKSILWVDKNADNIENPMVRPISELECKEAHEFENVVIALESRVVVEEVKKFLVSKGYDIEKIIF